MDRIPGSAPCAAILLIAASGCHLASPSGTEEGRGLAAPPPSVQGSTPAGASVQRADPGVPPAAAGGEPTSNEALAKTLANPIASLISVPIQYNYDTDLGPGDDGSQHRINVQPVIPVSLTPEWNVISRTILPILRNEDVPLPGDDEFGLGDIVQSAFFSPVEPTDSGWIWGVGPVFLLPTATDETLGGEKWGIGPTGVALRQEGPWTYGALANHIWDFAGDDDRDHVNATFLQPFASYTLPTATSFVLNTESTFNWRNDEWSVPLNAMLAQVLRVGSQPIQLQAGVRYWVDSPPFGPEGFGCRAQFTLLFPR